MLYSVEEVRWLSSRYYTNTVWLGTRHGITRPRLAHHGCWESNFTLLSTVTCCCGLPRDYSDCSVLYICLSVLCFVGGCTCNSYSVCRVCHPERTVQCKRTHCFCTVEQNSDFRGPRGLGMEIAHPWELSPRFHLWHANTL